MGRWREKGERGKREVGRVKEKLLSPSSEGKNE